LDASGFHVVATARDQQALTSLGTLGFSPLRLELTDQSSIELAAQRVLAETPDIRVLFLNAGYAAAGAIEDLHSSVWIHQFQANLFGHLELLRLLLRADSLRPGSRLIWCSSVLGISPMPNRAAYSASKAAIESVADAQRIELAHRGIHVCIVQPGPILTQFRANSLRSLHANVDIESSRYSAAYQATVARLSKQGPASPGTLNPDAVAQAVVHAALSPRPRHRYPVTRNTRLMAAMKRWLPSHMLDAVIRRAAGPEALPPSP
jgi:NAD(P)-dependent dehydrogenase (short-subunit alcohol dehydrogenase family)